MKEYTLIKTIDADKRTITKTLVRMDNEELFHYFNFNKPYDKKSIVLQVTKPLNEGVEIHSEVKLDGCWERNRRVFNRTIFYF